MRECGSVPNVSQPGTRHTPAEETPPSRLLFSHGPDPMPEVIPRGDRWRSLNHHSPSERETSPCLIVSRQNPPSGGSVMGLSDFDVGDSHFGS